MAIRSYVCFGFLLVIGTLLCSTGCFSGGGPPKYPVSGTVTFQGKPIENGAIVFFSTESGGGMQDGIDIVDGVFKGKVTAGPKRVFVEASRPGRTITNEEGEEHVILDWYIPSKYNESSALTHEILPSSNDGLVFDLE